MNILKEKNKRSRIVMWFGVFLLFMLICSVVSRGIYAMQIPRVVTGYASKKSIEHQITGDGTISEGSEHPVNIKTGILVDEVCVKEGEKIKEGDLLLKLNMDSLKQKCEDIQKTLQEEQTRLNDLTNQMSVEKNSADKEKRRAESDLSRITGEQNELVASAQREYDSACREENEFSDFETYFEEKKLSDETYQSMKNAKEKEKKAYEKELRTALREEWEQKKDDLKEAREAAETALLEAKKNSVDAIETARRTVEDAGKISQDNAGILAQKNVVAGWETMAEEYEKLREMNGEIRGSMAGSVAKVNVSAGDTTGESAAFLIASGEDGWIFTAAVSEEQKKYVSAGDSMELDFADAGIHLYDVEIVSIQKNTEGMYELHAQITEDGLALYDSAGFTVTKKGTEYPCCVPLSALYSGDQTTYVLIVQEENTILGTELRAVKREVNVVEKNDSYAALEGSPIEKDEPVITSSDRAVTVDAKVRPEEP